MQAELRALQQAFMSLACPATDDAFILRVFRFQAAHNPVYAAYIKHLDCVPASLSSVEDIPYLPIAFFKSYDVKTGEWVAERCFLSSGTTADQVQRSKHWIADTSFYTTHAGRIFQERYGRIEDIALLALLPSYGPDSSLLCMIEAFMQRADKASVAVRRLGDFAPAVAKWMGSDKRKIMFGGAVALYEAAERYAIPLGGSNNEVTIIETGGLKASGATFSRDQLHELLQKRFDVPHVDSEYGMTEMLSQAYGTGGILACSMAMRVRIRDLTDPLRAAPTGAVGGVDVLDLANLHSCCFLQTDDLGRAAGAGGFEILGRVSGSGARGCNMLYA